MNYFSTDFVKFFRELEKNNDREWFQSQKARYETAVKLPFEHFVADLITALAKDDKRMAVTPKDAIYRIYRDTRFSKDKTPYKLHASAAISPGGRKSAMTDPGFYLELGAKGVGLAGGVYMPEKPQIEDIRAAISADPKGWKKALNDKKFASLWGGIQGERNKILPPDYKALQQDIPEIANKQFYYWAELPGALIHSDELLPTAVEYYRASAPMRKFLYEALN